MIFLIGMPGAGKTYWGGQLSKAGGFSFIDLDPLVEQLEGKTIKQIFDLYEENGFRERETAGLKHAISKAPDIIACGGGTPAFADNLELMKASGCVIYLKAEMETLAERVQTDRDVRPLLSQAPFLYPTLQQMLAAREYYYNQADHILQVENLSISNFDEILASCISRQ